MAKKKKNGFISAMDNLPWIVKLLLAIPLLDGLCWGIYRVVKGAVQGKILTLVAGILWIFVGAAIFWIIDIISIILWKKVVLFA